MTLEKFTEPMQQVVKRFANGEFADLDQCVISAEFRITDKEK
jgi:hypothetical protein